MFKKLLSRRSMRNNEGYSLDFVWQNDAAGFDLDVEATRYLRGHALEYPGSQ